MKPLDQGIANRLSWTLANCPEARLRNPSRAVALARQNVDRNSQDCRLWNTLGVALYRAGDHVAATEALQIAIELRHGGNSFDWFVLAMIAWRRGEIENARKCYERGVRWMEEHDKQLLKDKLSHQEACRLRNEAEDVLGIKAASR